MQYLQQAMKISKINWEFRSPREYAGIYVFLIFYFMYIMMFCYLNNISGWKETAVPETSQFLDIAKD